MGQEDVAGTPTSPMRTMSVSRVISLSHHNHALTDLNIANIYHFHGHSLCMSSAEIPPASKITVYLRCRVFELQVSRLSSPWIFTYRPSPLIDRPNPSSAPALSKSPRRISSSILCLQDRRPYHSAPHACDPKVVYAVILCVYVERKVGSCCDV